MRELYFSIYKSESESFGTGISLALSWPTTGIQAFLEFGHYWNRTELESNRWTGYPFVTYTNARAIQKERGLEYWFEVSYLTDRLYLYGITVDIYGTAPTGPREANFRYWDPVFEYYESSSQSPLETGAFLSMAYIRAFAVEVVPTQRITFEPAVGAAYMRQNHGHELVLGFRLNICDMFGFSWYYVWERNNDAADCSIFNLEAGFRFGRKFAATK
jgi:hypothetical protein